MLCETQERKYQPLVCNRDGAVWELHCNMVPPGLAEITRAVTIPDWMVSNGGREILLATRSEAEFS